MKVGTEDKKKLMLAGAFGFVALFCGWYLYGILFGGPSAPPPAPAPIVKTVTPAGSSSSQKPIVGGVAQKVGMTSGQLDPTLHMDAMRITESLVYSGTGRNIFAAGPQEVAAVAIPKPITGPRTAPVQTIATGPPPVQGPPPINLKFFGTATSPNGNRRAFLVNGDDVYVASVGDVVQRRYRVISIAANSILIEDLPNSNKQTLPLMAN